MEETHLASLTEWIQFMRGQVYEKPSVLILHQTYKEWLAENPRGYVC